MNDQIGFIGTGTMGFPMARQFVLAGLAPLIHDMFRDSAQPLLDAGGQWADSIADLGARSSTVFLSLPGPTEVDQVVAGPGGLLDNMKAGSTIVDLSTNSVATVKSLADSAQARGIAYLDSPVSGGSQRADEGQLLLLVGGDREILERSRPLLEVISREIVYFGETGCGTVAKLVNNQLYLAGEVLFYEGLALASKAGIDLDALVELLNASGAGGIHSKLAHRVLNGVFDDGTFALKLAQKDVALALKAGDSLEVPMKVTAAAHELFQSASEAGFSNRNFWSAIRIMEEQAHTTICNYKEKDDE